MRMSFLVSALAGLLVFAAFFSFSQAPQANKHTITIYGDVNKDYVGWNMITSPMAQSLPISTIKAACPNMVLEVWYSNASAQKWQYSEAVLGGMPKLYALDPDKGYWVKGRKNATHDTCVFDVYGDPKPLSASLTLYPGWNMISNPTSASLSVADLSAVCDDKIAWAEEGSTKKSVVWHFRGSSQSWLSSFIDMNGIITALDKKLGYFVRFDNTTAGEKCSFNLPLSSADETTTTTTTIAPTQLACGNSCQSAASYAIPMSADTCNINRGSAGYYSFNSGPSKVNVTVTVTPKTNNDVDLFIYNNIACDNSAVVCSRTNSGTSAESCTFSANANSNYYVKIQPYDYSSYETLAKAAISITKSA